MSFKKFQAGGSFIDEDELFSDDAPLEGAPKAGEGDAPGTVAGEYQEPEPAPEPEAPEAPEQPLGEVPDNDLDPDIDLDPDVDPDAPEDPPAEVQLTGIESFLSGYGINGGMIEYEDGTSARFTDLGAEEQEEVLNSLVKTATPSVEEKYNLDTDEIDLINAFRESGLNDVGEYLNNIVDSRVSSYLTQRDAETLDFGSIENDDLYILHLKDKKPDMSNEEIASELNKAKELVTYDDTVGTIRDSYILKQRAVNSGKQNEEMQAFNAEVEMQREEVVSQVEDITDIAGAQLTDDIKEYLLHDIVELNDNNDPILMEKIFSDPETMFKANWFLNYGEDYISNLNEYWKKQVSLAHKKGYNQSINGMPENPTIIGADTRTQKGTVVDKGGRPQTFGQTVTEEDLFDD